MLDEMLTAAIAAMQNAYVPYSNFKVGACILTPDNKLFTGCNVENVSYSTTLCAESSAIAAMITAGHKQIKEMVIVSSGNLPCPPCGACRQRIAEFATGPDTKIYFCNLDRVCKHKTIAELLPETFTKRNMED